MGRKAMKNRFETWKTYGISRVQKSEKESKMMARFWAWPGGGTEVGA